MSTSDWNMSSGPANWELDTANYISAPSSLKFKGANLAYTSAILKHSISGAVREGQIVTWFMSNHLTLNDFSRNGRLVFRSKYDSTALTSCYVIHLYDTRAAWGENLNTSIMGFFHWDITLLVNTWYKIRLTWWEGYNYNNVLCTVAKLERWTGSAWIECTTSGTCSNIYDNYLYDPQRLNQGEAIQTVGLSGPFYTSYNAWFDDTIIYKA